MTGSTRWLKPEKHACGGHAGVNTVAGGHKAYSGVASCSFLLELQVCEGGELRHVDKGLLIESPHNSKKFGL